MKVFRCTCGYVNDLTAHTCGGCGESLHFTEKENTERIYKEIATAAARRYIPNHVYLVSFLVMLVGFFGSQPAARVVAGWDAEFSVLRLIGVIAWYFGLLGTNLLVSTVVVSVLYWRLTGRMYVEDRVQYARVGALDLSHATPLVSMVLTFWYYERTSTGNLTAPLPESFRHPMASWGVTLAVTFVICLVLSVVLFGLFRPKFRRRSF